MQNNRFLNLNMLVSNLVNFLILSIFIIGIAGCCKEDQIIDFCIPIEKFNISRIEAGTVGIPEFSIDFEYDDKNRPIKQTIISFIQPSIEDIIIEYFYSNEETMFPDSSTKLFIHQPELVETFTVKFDEQNRIKNCIKHDYLQPEYVEINFEYSDSKIEIYKTAINSEDSQFSFTDKLEDQYFIKNDNSTMHINYNLNSTDTIYFEYTATCSPFINSTIFYLFRPKLIPRYILGPYFDIIGVKNISSRSEIVLDKSRKNFYTYTYNDLGMPITCLQVQHYNNSIDSLFYTYSY